jgi:hypothetical protein
MTSKSRWKERSNPEIDAFSISSQGRNVIVPVAHTMMSRPWKLPSTVSIPVGVARLIKLGTKDT